jgi:sugar phosphate isomerase/epimerase
LQQDQIVVSPCCNPDWGLAEALAAYAPIGFRKFELFTSWAHSAVDFRSSPENCRAYGLQNRMTFHSMHLPPIRENDIDATLADAVTATKFAAALGVEVVLYKADTRPAYAKAAGRYLDAVEGIAVVPVVQNHFGTAVSTLADVKEVHEKINDTRMKSLLEVGHFHSAGVPWQTALDYLGDSVALVHIKDQVGTQSVPFGTGEVDLIGLFATLDKSGYTGGYVVEMEVTDRENTLRYLSGAQQYLLHYCSRGAQ